MNKIIKSTNTKNGLLANSILLMIATGIMALFGFVFWILIARTFKSSTVGLATTAIAASSLLALLSLVGFDTVLVRFLPKSDRRNDYISSGLIIVGAAAIVISSLFCLSIPIISPKLSYITSNPIYVIDFILVTILTSWNVLTNAVFIAYRKVKFILIINIIFSALKMVLPFVFKSGGPMTIFTLIGIAQFINVVLSIIVLSRWFGYMPVFSFNFDLLNEIKFYGFAAYLASLFNLLPGSAMPIVVIDILGSSAAAYFYIAFTIANLLYTIGFSTVQSLFAESSHNEVAIYDNVQKAIRIISIIFIPAMTIVIILGSILLGVFGRGYSNGALGILRLLSISGIFIAISSVLSSIFKIRKRLKALVLANFTNAFVTIILGIVFARPFGLIGIGWAWLIGSFTSCLLAFYFVDNKYFFPFLR